MKLRITERELTEYQEAAKEAGMSLSMWVREACKQKMLGGGESKPKPSSPPVKSPSPQPSPVQHSPQMAVVRQVATQEQGRLLTPAEQCRSVFDSLPAPKATRGIGEPGSGQPRVEGSNG